jgi:hypothetical protein
MIALHLRPARALTGFALLTGTASLIFGLAFIQALSYNPVFPVLLGLFLVGLAAGFFQEGIGLASALADFKAFSGKDACDFLAVFAGTLATFYLNRKLGIGAVLASSLVGVLGALIFKAQAVAIFCGSFAGMSCPITFSSWYCIGAAGVLAGIIFLLGKDLFKGVGGKLGTIAFAATLGASYLRGIELLSLPMPDWEHAGLIIIYSITGVVATFVLNHRFSHGPVLASAITGILAGVLLPSLHGAQLGSTLAIMVFCASFAGMSDRTRLPNEGAACIAGLLCGLVFIHSTPYLGGAGGKLGTIAFGAVIAYSGVDRLLGRLLARFIRL